MACCGRTGVVAVNNLERANIMRRPPVSDKRPDNIKPPQKYATKIDRHRV